MVYLALLKTKRKTPIYEKNAAFMLLVFLEHLCMCRPVKKRKVEEDG